MTTRLTSTTSEGSGDVGGDDDANTHGSRGGSKKGEEEEAAASTSKKAQDLLNAFRKQREKLRSDPRVKEAFSEAQKFKEEMKREVGMEKMFVSVFRFGCAR